MDSEMVLGLRDLSIAVGDLLKRPVGARHLRTLIENSGARLGVRRGRYQIFRPEDVQAVALLVTAAESKKEVS